MGAVDVGAALRVCSKTRPYTMDDRNKTEFYWLVQRSDALGLSSSKAKFGFILKWQVAAAGGSSGLKDMGSVHLEDIKSITYAAGSGQSGGAGTIILQLAQSVRALKSCGGRTRLLLRASHPAEDAKWHMCLKTLWEVSRGHSSLGSDFDDM